MSLPGSGQGPTSGTAPSDPVAKGDHILPLLRIGPELVLRHREELFYLDWSCQC